MRAIGKVYKPALRAQAARQVLLELLVARQLTSRARVNVDEAPGGLAVNFTVQDADAEAVVRELMKPFALSYAVVRGMVS